MCKVKCAYTNKLFYFSFYLISSRPYCKDIMHSKNVKIVYNAPSMHRVLHIPVGRFSILSNSKYKWSYGLIVCNIIWYVPEKCAAEWNR